MEQKQIANNMVSAYIEQILMWLVIFVGFVTFLFLVIDYSNVMRIKGNLDLMTEYGARMVSLGRTEEQIADKLNTMKSVYFRNIVTGDVVCELPTLSDPATYQATFYVNGMYTSTKVLDPVNSIPVKRVVFNDSHSNETLNGTDDKGYERECTLTLYKQ